MYVLVQEDHIVMMSVVHTILQKKTQTIDSNNEEDFILLDLVFLFLHIIHLFHLHNIHVDRHSTVIL